MRTILTEVEFKNWQLENTGKITGSTNTTIINYILPRVIKKLKKVVKLKRE